MAKRTWMHGLDMKLGHRHKELQQRDSAPLYCSLIGLPKQKRNWPPVCHQFNLFLAIAKCDSAESTYISEHSTKPVGLVS